MKIVITVFTYEPSKNGVQNVTKYLAEGLALRGHSVSIITQSIEGAPREEVINDVHIFRIEARTKMTFNFGNKREFIELLKKETMNCDALINVCLQTALTDWTFDLLNEIKCKKVLYLHGIADFSLKKEDFKSPQRFAHKIWNILRYRLYYSKNKKNFLKYDVITQLHDYDFGAKFFREKLHINCKVIENAADDQFFITNPVSLNLPNNYLLFVANYIERKNQQFVLEAFYLSESSKEMSLIFIGSKETTYYHKLLSLKEKFDLKYGVHNVQFLTNIARTQIPEYTQRASIYLMGSTWEAYPISIVEALASGVPYISTDVGIVKYLPGGIVVSSPKEMAYWIDLFYHNKECLDSYSKAGYSYAINNLTITKKVDLLESILSRKGECDV